MKKSLLSKSHLKSLQLFFLVMLTFTSVRLFAQSGDSTIFKDDFNRSLLGDFWQANASWSIKNASAYNFIDGTGGTLKTTNSYNDSSYIIETTAGGFTNSYRREFRITFGQSNLSYDSMYVLSYHPYNGGRLILSLSSDNVYFPQTLDEAVIYPQLMSDKPYKFKIARYKSGLIQVYIDKGEGYGNMPLLEAIDQSYLQAGHIGWQVDTQTSPESFYVYDIALQKPAADKPAVKEKPAEDDLITQVNAESGKQYQVAKLNKGVNQFIDRNYTITSIPTYLQGASFVQTAMEDKKDTTDHFLRLFVKKSAVIYIGYDPRGTAIPSWLSDWSKTGDSIGTSDQTVGYLQVYSKLIESGNVYPYPLLLGGNLASPAFGSEINYLVAAVERPNISNLQAEDAFLSGAVIANDHTGYNEKGFVDFINASEDYIEWTVNINVPGIYTLGFKYANGKDTDRPMQIENDGVKVEVIPFYSTSSWSSWAFYRGPEVFLGTGVHKVRATTTGSSGPNIDELSLYYTSDNNPNFKAQKHIPKNNFINNVFDRSIRAYPNPIAESTKIFYSLKEKTKVVLSIYSSQGQRVQTLVNAVQYKGDYQVPFYAGKLSSGTYFYQLQTGDEVKVGKLLKE